jgi:hypothetical protein
VGAGPVRDRNVSRERKNSHVEFNPSQSSIREKAMSQRCVERVIGVLATDESLRLKFRSDRRAVLRELLAKGMELTHCEQWALARLDPEALSRFANEIDGRLQKASLDGGGS